MLLALVVTLAVLFVVECLRLNVFARRHTRGPFLWPLVYNLPQMAITEMLGRQTEWWYDVHRRFYPHSFSVRLPGDLTFNCVTCQPENVEFALASSSWRQFQRPAVFSVMYEKLLGKGIFVSNGAKWQRHRRFGVPLFTTSHIANHMLPVFQSPSTSRRLLLSPLAAAAASGATVDTFRTFNLYTMHTFLAIGLGCSDTLMSDDEREEFMDAFDRLSQATTHSFLLGNGAFFKATVGATVDRDSAAVFKYVDRGIAAAKCEHAAATTGEDKGEHGNAASARNDIMSHCLRFRDPDTGEPLGDQELRDVFCNYAVAGKDTTALTLCLLLYELGRPTNAEARARVEREIDEVIGTPTTATATTAATTAPITAEQLERLRYTRAAMMETLRLHPPVPGDNREAIADCTLPDGTRVRKGEFVMVSPYAAGRLMLEEAREEPLRFEPARWLDDDAVRRYNSSRFTPFWFGSMRCLGERMAYAEVLCAMSMIVSAGYRLDSVGEQQRWDTSITSIPRGGMHMRVSRRSA